MKMLRAVGVCALVLGASQAARADDKAACLDASSQAQTLRDSHKLVEARDQLRVCARASCPGVVQKDCSMWLEEIDKALPSVVFSVRDFDGRDLGTIRVSEAGKVLATSLDGTAMAMNPGQHTFRFDAPDGRSVEHQVIVREGQKALTVTATLSKAPEAPPASPPPVQPAAPSPAPQPVSPAQPARAPSHTAAYVVGGIGVAGVIAGSVTGLMAMSKKSTANQSCVGLLCSSAAGADAANSGKTLGNVSTVAFGVGIAGLAVGTVLWFTTKPSAEAQATGIRSWHAGVEPLPSGGFMLSTGSAW